MFNLERPLRQSVTARLLTGGDCHDAQVLTVFRGGP